MSKIFEVGERRVRPMEGSGLVYPVFFPLNKSPHKLHSDMRWHFYNASTSPLLQLEA